MRDALTFFVNGGSISDWNKLIWALCESIDRPENDGSWHDFADVFLEIVNSTEEVVALVWRQASETLRNCPFEFIRTIGDMLNWTLPPVVQDESNDSIVVIDNLLFFFLGSGNGFGESSPLIEFDEPQGLTQSNAANWQSRFVSKNQERVLIDGLNGSGQKVNVLEGGLVGNRKELFDELHRAFELPQANYDWTSFLARLSREMAESSVQRALIWRNADSTANNCLSSFFEASRYLLNQTEIENRVLDDMPQFEIFYLV